MADKAPPVIERFVRQVVVTNKAVSLYPATSEIPRQNATNAVMALGEALEEYTDVTLSVTKQGLFFEDLPVFPGQVAFVSFAKELYNHRLALVRFHVGTTIADLLAFLTILQNSPDDVVASGGFEAMMWEQGVNTVTVVETQVTLIDQSSEDGEDAEASEGPTVAVQKKHSNVPRSRERIELARVSANTKALEDYLTERYDEFGNELSIGLLGKRFSELASMANESSGETADEFMHMFAQALWQLEPSLRHELLQQQLLPEAKTSEAVGNAVKRIDLREVLRMLADGDEEFDAKRTGFARALKNLVQIAAADRDEIARTATEVMMAAGASEETAGDVIAESAPAKLKVRRAASTARSMDSAAAMVLKLIDRAPLAQTADGATDPEVAALQEEAALGVGDGDVIATLIAIAGLDNREAQFAGTMSALEDTLDMLVTRGDIETAAEAAITLIDAARNPGLTTGQRNRLENAVTRFARPEDVRAITQTLRIYAPGQPEYEAAQQLLNTLGVFAVRPLLEQLANETDRVERKALVDLISKDAEKHIAELGTHVADPRWFFVRNVVAILGSTKSSAILSPLERPLRHQDARVRRETIRAISSIHERRAVEMLVAALDDEDAHNVQLAARYLGLRKTESAIPALEAVARGEGRGNRENGPRVEAIEALGRMGAQQALPTLQVLSRKRAIIGASRARELRTAAESAIAKITAHGGAR